MSSQQAPTLLSRRCPDCGALYPADADHICAASPTVSAPAAAAAITAKVPISATAQTLSRSASVERSAQDDLVGLILGERYEIEKRLSAGGMGVVYRGRHIVLDSPIAVKILLKPQDAEAQRRFLQEAKLASLIRHPNTVYISDFGLLPDGRSYLVMEYLQGPTLRQALQGGRLSVPRACQIARQIAEGLQAVHDKGIVHRDLKPENIFLIRDGQKEFVKIVDFGIALAAPTLRVERGQAAAGGTETGQAGDVSEAAKPPGADASAELSARQTLPGTVLGTPHYMSPEQADGADVDARTDQYALGCILYEMLTGEVPFDHPTNVMSIMFKHVSEAVTPPRKRCPDARIPEAIEALVLRTLAKAREDRFPSLAELAAALSREIALLAPEDSLLPSAGGASAISLSGRLSTQVVLRPRRWQLLSVYAAVAVLLLGVGILGYRQYRAGQQLRSRQLSAAELSAVRQTSLQVLSAQLQAASDAAARELRLSVLQSAGKTHELALQPILVSLLADADGDVQALAAEALGQLGDRRAVTPLAELLGRAKLPAVQAAAAAALDLLDDDRGQRALLQMLDGSDELARFRAAYVLSSKGHRKATAVLSGLLERSHPPDEVMLDALTRLAQAGEDGARRQLLSRLSSAEQPQKRLPIAYRLAQLGEPQGRDVLRQLAENPGPQQLLAARLYVGPEHPSLSELFRQVLRDPAASGSAQLLAVEGLGSGGRLQDIGLLQPKLVPGGIERLRLATAIAVLRLSTLDASVLSEQSLAWAQDALRDSSWLVRQAGTAVLGDLESDAATQALSGMLKDGDLRVRKSAVRALGRKRTRGALLALREALYDAEISVREEALRGLSRVAKVLSDQGQGQVKQDVAGWLRDVLTQGRPSEQVLARGALLRLGDDSQRPALAALQASPDREARQLLIEQSDRQDAGAMLVALLGDADAAVRLSAAQKLAEQGDSRSLPVLRDALSKGGRSSVMAFALLRRLGDQAAPPRDLDRLLHGPDVAERMATVEALGKLPPDLAVTFLLDAARDAERLVRRLVAEVSADLPDGPQGPPGLPILRLLQQDSDAGVRFRAAALIARFGDLSRFRPAGPRPTAAPREDGDGVPRLLRPSTTDASPADGGTEAATPAAASDAGVPSEAPDAGTSDSASPVIDGGGDKALDAIGQLARKGLQAFSAKDFGKALKLLNKAEKQCEKKKGLAEACAQLSQELAVRIAQIYEKQDQLVEAMSEYEKALRLVTGSAKATAALKAEAESGQARLRGQLGRVTLPKTVAGRCREVSEWMLPGTNVVTINGAQTFVKVRPGEVQNLGSCP